MKSDRLEGNWVRDLVPPFIRSVFTRVAMRVPKLLGLGRPTQEYSTEGSDWLPLIDAAETNFSQRAVAYYVGVGAETRGFSFAERKQLAASYGRVLGEPRLLISEIAQGGSEEGFHEGVRAWFARECIPFNDQRGVADALNDALLARAKSKAERELDEYERATVR